MVYTSHLSQTSKLQLTLALKSPIGPFCTVTTLAIIVRGFPL